MIYVIILLFMLILSYHYDIRDNKRNKQFWYISVQIILILLAGLRFRIGSDTQNYINRFYNEYPTLEDFDFSDYPIGGDGPLYVLINSVVIAIGGKFYMVQLLQSSFVILLIFNYIKRYSTKVFTFAFLYFIVCYIQFNFEIMRGSMSIAVSLYANDYALSKKWIKAYTLYIIALLFHVQAFVLFLTPFFLWLKLNHKGIVVLFVAFIGGIVIQRTFGDIVNALTLAEAIQNKAVSYANNDIYNGAGGNFNFYIVYIFPLLLYSLFSFIYIRSHNKNDTILRLEPLAMFGWIFLLLQMNLQILSRYVDYFAVYLLLFITEFAVLVCHQKRKKLSHSIINCIFIFLPFFILTGYQHRNTYRCFFPYNSIIDRKIDRDRENSIDNPLSNSININEY